MIKHHNAMVRRDWLLILAFVLAVASMTVPTLLTGLAPDPLSYGPLPFAVAPNPLTAGRAIEVAVLRCNHDPFADIDYTVTRELVRDDGLVLMLPTTNTQLGRGCTVSRPLITIPRGTPPGTYRIQGIGYAHGTLRSSDEFYYTDWFTVQEAQP